MRRGLRLSAVMLLALAASGLVALFTANSLVRVRTFTADSMNYVDVARRVGAGDGLVQSTGGFNQPFWLSGSLELPSAFTAQAPGYPLAIASLSGGGLDAADAALLVSAVAYAAILALVLLLGQRMGGCLAGAVALGVAVLFVPLVHLGRSALSECLGVAVVLLFLLLLDRFLERREAHGSGEAVGSSRASVRRDLARCLGLGVLSGAGFGVRYSLWPLPLVGVAALLVTRSDRRTRAPARSGAAADGWRRWLATIGQGAFPALRGRATAPTVRSPGTAWLQTAAFSLGALAVPASILSRNLLVDGRLLPQAMPSAATLSESLVRAVTAVFGGWRSTELGNWQDAALLAGALAGVLALTCRVRLFGGRDAGSAARGREPGGIAGRRVASRQSPAAASSGRSGRMSLPVLACLWAVLYIAAVVWRSTLANFDPIGVRLVLPATVPLLPVLGALTAAVLPAPRRDAAAWLPVAVLAACLGVGCVREATLWSGGGDARATESRSERQQWLRDHTGPGDLVIGGGTMDVPFLHPGRFAISYAGLPYTEVLTGAGLERIAERHCGDFDRLLLVVRPGVQLGGGRSDEDPSDWLGALVADARAGRIENWPLLEPLAELDEARVYGVRCPA